VEAYDSHLDPIGSRWVELHHFSKKGISR